MFKNIFIKLCNNKGESPSAVCQKIGLSNAVFSSWTDESIPRKATLMKIADYFGVTVDELVGDKKSPEETSKLNKQELLLISRYRELNDEGKEKLTEYADDLCSSGKYKKDNTADVVLKEA